MNPILKIMNQNQFNALPSTNNSNITDIITQLKTGKINPKQKSLAFLEKLTPQQKIAMKQIIPQILNLGNIFGVSKKNMELFKSEIQKYL